MTDELVKQLSSYAAPQGLLDDYGNIVQAAPVVENLQHDYVAVGEPALFPGGVVFKSHWKASADGMAVHSRATARALALAGIPTKLEPIGRSLLLDDELDEDARRVAWMSGMSLGTVHCNLVQTIFSDPDYLNNVCLPPGARFGGQAQGEEQVLRNTIVYTSWERDRVHPKIVSVLNRMAEVWVPCQQNAQAFQESGVERLRIIPYGYDPEAWSLAEPRGRTPVPDGKRFYMIGKWEPRKNQHAVIGAFLQAFTPKDKASLYIKTGSFGADWASYPLPKEGLEFWSRSSVVKAQGWTAEAINKRVRIHQERITDAALRDIHRTNNIYVSASCGEAVNIPAFESKVAGNRMIYVPWGGPADFAEESDVRVAYDMKPVHPGYNWPEKDALWAQPLMKSLVESMQAVTVKSERRVPYNLEARYSLAAVANQMQQRLRTMWPLRENQL